MRAIEPDTEYQIYTIRLAVPLRLGEAAACDAINETLGPCVGTPETATSIGSRTTKSSRAKRCSPIPIRTGR